MNVLDLFSGIGGFSLGLERSGFKTVAFCEVDKKAQKVLKKHWPEVPIFNDVKNLNKETLNECGITVDVICGGFPCQDISVAGKGVGIEGERSGLWSEFARLIGELRPRYAIVENVSALLNRGIDRVLGDLAEIGYDAEWHCIPASAVGAPHRRDRIWIVAYPSINEGRNLEIGGSSLDVGRVPSNDGRRQPKPEEEILAYSNCSEREARQSQPLRNETGGEGNRGTSRDGAFLSNPNGKGLQGQRSLSRRIGEELNHAGDIGGWETEPAVGRVADGLPGRVDRLKQLGNAVVPQIPELIGRAIIDFEANLT